MARGQFIVWFCLIVSTASSGAMRELTTDRPDKTESPITVDQGRFQVELDAVTLTREGSQNTITVAPFNFKYGLTDSIDLQLIFETFRVLSGPVAASGIGDLRLRAKFNLWGADGRTKTAFALMPHIKIGTASAAVGGNNTMDGGLIVPLAINLPSDFGLGLMLQIDNNLDDGATTRHFEVVSTATLGHEIVGNLAGYVEFFNLVSTQTGAGWAATLDFGLTYGLSETAQLDAGCNFGLTDAADDLNPFVGFSIKF